MTKESEPIKPTPPTEKQSLLFQIVTFPKHIGQLVFDLLQYKEAADYAKMMVGYGLIVVVILVWMSILVPNALASLWRFFFPE